MRKTILILVAILLSACSAIPGLDSTFENVLSCAVAGDKAYVNSEYGPLSVGTRLRDVDVTAICPVPTFTPASNFRK